MKKFPKSDDSQKIWRNDSRLSGVLQNVSISNQENILREVLEYGNCDVVKRYAYSISEKRLEAARDVGVDFLEHDEYGITNFVNFEGREHIVRVCPEGVAESMNRSGYDKLIKKILGELSGDKNKGVLQFMPFYSNGNNARSYLKKELPCISFVDLKYNPKQIEQRAYKLSKS